MRTETQTGDERTEELMDEFDRRYHAHQAETAAGEARLARMLEECRRRFAADAVLVRAPGRVNLIGEHTDYNDGFVLPIAIEYDVRFAVSPRSDREVRIYSLDFGQEIVFDLDHLPDAPAGDWGDYIRGMAVELTRAGYLLRGMEGVVEGNIPQGAGLSSSAAMEVAAGLAFGVVSQQAVDPPTMARLAQAAENRFVGVRCGIMDQFISRMGHPDHALFLDCRSLEHELIPIPSGDYAFVVTNSRQSRELAGSAYNERRAQCEAAVSALAATAPGVTALRDVTPALLETHSASLDPLVYRRARHVVTENQRVLEAVKALRAGEMPRFGAMMNASHDSLRDDYSVSSPALDALVAAARDVEGCVGSRLTGAGFGGCTVSLVRADRVEAFRRHVSEAYLRDCEMEAEFYVTRAAAGAGLLSPP